MCGRGRGIFTDGQWSVGGGKFKTKELTFEDFISRLGELVSQYIHAVSWIEFTPDRNQFGSNAWRNIRMKCIC